MFDPYARLAGVYDELVVDPCFALWADFAEGAWADDPRPVRTILDVCCGTGLMTVELARRGFAMTGIDASAAMLALAGVRLSPASTLVEARLPDLPDSPVLAGPFDAMVSTFDGLNYLDPADLRLALTRLVPRLRHGGWFVFDVHAEPMLDFVHDVCHGVARGPAGRSCGWRTTPIPMRRSPRSIASSCTPPTRSGRSSSMPAWRSSP